MNARLFALTLCATVVIVGCGDGDDTTDAASTDSTTAASEISTDLTTKPEVPVPDGDPPTELVIEDVVVGDGPEAIAGDTVTVQYVGVDYATGEQFDASWDNGQPFSFALGTGSVIPGWDQGVAGMKVGGRRELIIPSDLAYGDAGSPPVIAPGATLVFVVDLLKVKQGK